MIEGYLLLNSEGARLTRNYTWSFEKDAGWLWTEEEVHQVLGWVFSVVYYQRAQLVEENGDVNVYALSEPEAL